MKLHDVRGLTERIRMEYGPAQAHAGSKAVRVLQNCPALLEQNVKEWAAGQKLTDIYIGQYSLPMILAIWKSRDFLKALELMTELEKGNRENAELQIWKMRR